MEENEKITDHSVRISVLEAILPRIEDEMRANGLDHKQLALKMDSISDGMVTREMMSSIITSNDNLKKKTDSLQYQVGAIVVLMFLGSLPGMQSAISSFIINVLPHLL